MYKYFALNRFGRKYLKVSQFFELEPSWNKYLNSLQIQTKIFFNSSKIKSEWVIPYDNSSHMNQIYLAVIKLLSARYLHSLTTETTPLKKFRASQLENFQEQNSEFVLPSR